MLITELNKSMTTEELEKLLYELIKRTTKRDVLYMNIGFVFQNIFKVYPDLKRFLEIYNEKYRHSNEYIDLNNKLCDLKDELTRYPDEYLYKLVKKINRFEIANLKELKNILKKEMNLHLKDKYLELFRRYNIFYFTIYYEETFFLDSLVILKEGKKAKGLNRDDLKTNLYYLTGFLLIQISRIDSIRSAISAIMGRNMSHNIGSHVMARISTGGINGWTSNLSKDQILEKFLDDKKQANEDDEKKKKEEKKRNMSGIIEWSKDIQYLSRYIQQRMDFIAQISTEWPSWTEPAYLMNDLMRWFLSQKHLLNHIAASEGLQAHSFENDKTNDIRFHVFLVPEKNCWNNCTAGNYEKPSPDRVENRMNYLKKNSKEQESQDEKHLKCIPNKDSSPTQDCKSCKSCRRILLFTPGTGDAHCRTDEDIPLAIPGGIVGYHAFYIILENIIRNGAKHDYTKEGHDHFDVVIEVLYDPEETIGIQKSDEKKKIPAFLFRIYNNTSKIGDGLTISDDKSKKGMNNVLQTSIITETGELNKGNWGLAEMKIAAGYLQQRDISHIGDGKERITGEKTDNFINLGENENGSDVIIRAVESPIGTLGYEFYIPRPRTVGIVCPKEPENAQ